MPRAKKEDEGQDDAAAADTPTDGSAQQGVTKDENAIDETVPGGRYKVGDKWVNAEGKEIK
jgi:hypothetical protein